MSSNTINILTIPVISNILNIGQYLQEDNDSKNLHLKFVNYTNPIEVLNNGFEIIVADGYLLTPEFWETLHQQLEQGESSLKWINCTFAGVNAIFENIRKTNNSERLIQLLIENNVRLTKIGVFGSHMFEYLIQHMMNELRHYDKVLDHQSQSLWIGKTAFHYKTLDRVKIGLLGYGNIGKHICKTFKQIYPTIKIHVYRNSQIVEEESQYLPDKFFYGREQLNDFISSCDYDFLISILPSTPETRYMLNAQVLEKLPTRSQCCFINVGRGDVISESMVIEALDKQLIRKAILDVFEVEPLPVSSQFWTRKDVLVTPHISALSIPHTLVDSFFNNFHKISNTSSNDDGTFSFEKLEYQCDWNKGY